MKALVQSVYGSPELLELRDVEMPALGPGKVLVRVYAASVNALDWHTTRGMPYLIRLFDGLRVPRHPIRGVDLAGRVEAVGDAVTGLATGDDVFGGSNGSFAEYTVTTPDRLARKPKSLTYGEAATLHIAGLTALQGLRDKARVRPGQRVLILGAGGGVGTLAVQVAKWLGAHVTALTRTESLDALRSLGADEVIDHSCEDFALRDERYDVLFDIGGRRSFADCRRVMARRGTLVVVGAPAGRWLAPLTRMMRAVALSPFVSQRLVPFLSTNNGAHLAQLAALAEAGHLRAVIDRTYPLSEAAQAIRYVGEGHARGKVVVEIPGS
jgi:NADPH:quinone reductase-like Zn-dependent oxidoreductase